MKKEPDVLMAMTIQTDGKPVYTLQFLKLPTYLFPFDKGDMQQKALCTISPERLEELEEIEFRYKGLQE